MRIIPSIAFVAVVLVPLVSYGHHSAIGRYDGNAVTEIEGMVTKVQWTNPHIYLTVQVDLPSGENETWELEGGAPVRLQRAGIPPDSIRVGERIKAAGDSPLTGRKEIFVTNILVPGGQELLMRPGVDQRWGSEVAGDYSFRFATEGDSSRPELGLFRAWLTTASDPRLTHRAENHADLANSYPLSDAGLAVFQQFDPATDNPTQDCVPKGMPEIMDQPYPMEFVDRGGEILLRITEYDTERVIRMGRTEVPEGQPASLLGYSTGRWEGTALVVTTTHLNYPWVSQLGIPQSEESVLVERFSPSDDGSRLHYEITVSDPINFTEPFTLDKQLLYVPGQEVLPYKCAVRD